MTTPLHDLPRDLREEADRDDERGRALKAEDDQRWRGYHASRDAKRDSAERIEQALAATVADLRIERALAGVCPWCTLRNPATYVCSEHGGGK